MAALSSSTMDLEGQLEIYLVSRLIASALKVS
jgi:hypothetical protein